MGEVKLSPKTTALLADPLLGDGDVDQKILRLLASEYQRRLTDVQTVDQQLSQKYQTTFADFLDRRTTVQHESSWEVEKDAIDWENAIAALPALRDKLKAIEELINVASE